MDELSDSPYTRAVGPMNRGFPGLVQPGNIINLYNRPATQNPGGSYSTTHSASFGINGNEVLLPTVVGGQHMTDQEAVNRFRQTGQHLGMFKTPEEADAYAQQLHNSQEAMGVLNPPPSVVPQTNIFGRMPIGTMYPEGPPSKLSIFRALARR